MQVVWKSGNAMQSNVGWKIGWFFEYEPKFLTKNQIRESALRKVNNTTVSVAFRLASFEYFPVINSCRPCFSTYHQMRSLNRPSVITSRHIFIICSVICGARTVSLKKKTNGFIIRITWNDVLRLQPWSGCVCVWESLPAVPVIIQKSITHDFVHLYLCIGSMPAKPLSWAKMRLLCFIWIGINWCKLKKLHNMKLVVSVFLCVCVR